MTKQELYNKVANLVDEAQKDFTNLWDWIIEGDTDDMTPEEIAEEWNELPAMEKDS